MSNASIIRLLLSQAKPDLRSKTRRCPAVGIGNKRLINGLLVVKLDVQFLINDITNIRPKLEVDISVGNGIEFVNFPLNGFCISKRNIHPKGQIILEDNETSLRLEWQFHVILRESQFEGNILAAEFSNLCIGNIQRQIPFCFILEVGSHPALRSNINTDQRRKLFGNHDLTNDINRQKLTIHGSAKVFPVVVLNWLVNFQCLSVGELQRVRIVHDRVRGLVAMGNTY